MNRVIFPDITKYSDKPKVIALGKFHTFHLGHQEIFKRSKELADKKNFEFVIMLFVEESKKHISNYNERKILAKYYSPDYIMEFHPTKENFNISFKEFENLLTNMNIQEIFCGTDFRYGKNREGNINSLSRKFNVNVVKDVLLDKERLSTSVVYKSIKDMNFSLFYDVTGRYFSYEGEVVRGLGNGKKFGMPTANIIYPDYKIDIGDGIFFSYVTYNGEKFNSLTSISSNPTLNADNKTYETYLYNFDKDIYGEILKIELIKKYRDTIKFNSIKELVEKLMEDKEIGKKYFKL